MPARQRLDVVLVQRGLAETRERAQSLIHGGSVSVGGQKATKVSQPVTETDEVTVEDNTLPYVGRGALKLLAALDHWQIDPAGLVAIDAGASTGGFTDLMLQRGATRVYAVDVGYGQLHYKLRGDPRVVVMERTNIRTLTSLAERPSLAVADLSFISLRVTLPAVFNLLSEDAQLVTLVKPQFEAGRGQVGKGGVVRDPLVHRQVVTSLVEWSAEQPWPIVDLIPSPIRGPAGNVEFLALWRRPGDPVSHDVIVEVVDAAQRI